MIKLYDFIDPFKLEEIANQIKNEEDFEYINNVAEYEFEIKSSKAATNWENGTKANDYIVCVNFYTPPRGRGGPFGGRDLEMLSDVDELTKFIDNFLYDNDISGYNRLNEGQMNLFGLNV